MFFYSYKAVIAKQDEEIKYLRGLVKDLQDRLLANSASEYMLLKANASEEKSDVKVYDEIAQKIISLTAETDEEVEQQKAALDELQEMMRH